MYCELHAKTAFSFLEGASEPEAMAEHAARLGLPAVAVSDRAGVYGIPRFYKAARDVGVEAIVGAEVVFEDKTRLPLLVENARGYSNLCRLLTSAALDRPKGEARVTWDLVGEHAAGLFALTGGEDGPLARAWRGAGEQAAGLVLRRLVEVFGAERLAVEVHRHQRRGEEARNAAMVRLARAAGVSVEARRGGAQRRHGAPGPCGRRVGRRHPGCPLRRARGRAAGGRLCLSASPLWTGHRRAAARGEPCPPSALAVGDGATLRRSSRGSRRNHAGSRALCLPVAPAPVPLSHGAPRGRPRRGGGIARARRGGSTRALPHHLTAGSPTARARARPHREARTLRVLPRRPRHCAFLSGAGHPRPGARLRRQLGSVLRVVHHQRRPHRLRAALRAFSLRRARRVAGHRHRPPLG